MCEGGEKLVLAAARLAQLVLARRQDALGGGARLHFELERAGLLLQLRDHEQALARIFYRGVALCGQDVCVLLANIEQRLRMLAERELANRVAAQQRECVAARELLPQFFQPHRGAVLPLGAEQSHHLPEGAHRWIVLAGARDDRLDDVHESPLLRPAIQQQLLQSLARLERDILATSAGGIQVDASRTPVLLERVEVRTRGDHDPGAAAAQRAADELADGLEQERLVLVELHGVGTLGQGLRVQVRCQLGGKVGEAH